VFLLTLVLLVELDVGDGHDTIVNKRKAVVRHFLGLIDSWCKLGR
jgi:hypothetical protein